MKIECERCRGPLSNEGDAMICSYECTYCVSCANELERTCPSCTGELIRRPKRRAATTQGPISPASTA